MDLEWQLPCETQVFPIRQHTPSQVACVSILLYTPAYFTESRTQSMGIICLVVSLSIEIVLPDFLSSLFLCYLFLVSKLIMNDVQ